MQAAVAPILQIEKLRPLLRLTHLEGGGTRTWASILQCCVAFCYPWRALPALTVQIYWQAKALRSLAAESPLALSLTLGFPNGPPIIWQLWLCWGVLWEMLLQEFRRGKKKELGFYLILGERLTFPLNHTSPRIFRLSGLPPGWLSRAGTCVVLIPPLCPPGVNVTMPTQPGMPPVSSTQLQIDTALQEFQLVDLSRRFLVHDSFWALPEQFLGNKVKGPPWVGRGPVPPRPCSEPAWAPLPLKLGGGHRGSLCLGEVS